MEVVVERGITSEDLYDTVVLVKNKTTNLVPKTEYYNVVRRYEAISKKDPLLNALYFTHKLKAIETNDELKRLPDEATHLIKSLIQEFNKREGVERAYIAKRIGDYYRLGVYDHNGPVPKPELLESEKWYVVATDLGNMEAANSLGLMFLHGGDGLQADREKAKDAFEKAMGFGSHEARYWWSKIIIATGDEREKKLCFKIMNRVPWEKHCIKSKVLLAKCMAEGIGTAVDIHGSMEVLESLLFKEVSPEASYLYSRISIENEKFDTENDRVLRALKFSASLKYPPAYYLLGQCYEHGVLVEEDLVEALRCYGEAKRLGVDKGTIDFGRFKN